MIPLKRLFSAVLIAALAAVCDGHETQKETSIRIAITLQDNSRIIGEPSQDTLLLNTSYAEIKLPLSSLDAVEIPTNRELATIRLRNADKLQGTLNFKKIDLNTLFGKVSLEIQSIIRIENISKQPLLAGQDLLEYYPFNGNAQDESGNAKHGTVHGNTDFGDGKHGKAVQFHNPETSSPFEVRDYIELPKISVTQFTVSHWVKFNSNAYPHDCVTYSIGTHTSSDFFWIHITQSGLISGGLLCQGQSVNSATVDISDKSWHLITVTVSDNDLIFYHNGEKLDAKQIPFNVKFEDAPQFIGLSQWEWSGPHSASRFNGAIDELSVYKRALTPEEVQKIYRAE